MLEFITALRNSDLLRYEGLETCHDNLAGRGQDWEGSTLNKSWESYPGMGKITEAAHFSSFLYDDK